MNHCGCGASQALQATDGATFSLSIEAWHRKQSSGTGQRPAVVSLTTNVFRAVGRRKEQSAANHHPAQAIQGLDADGLVSLEPWTLLALPDL